MHKLPLVAIEYHTWPRYGMSLICMYRAFRYAKSNLRFYQKKKAILLYGVINSFLKSIDFTFNKKSMTFINTHLGKLHHNWTINIFKADNKEHHRTKISYFAFWFLLCLYIIDVLFILRTSHNEARCDVDINLCFSGMVYSCELFYFIRRKAKYHWPKSN